MPLHNPDAISAIVDLMDKNNIGYCSVNHNRNRCMECGYEDASAELDECPKCHSKAIDPASAHHPAILSAPPTAGIRPNSAELNDRIVHE